MVLVMAPMSNSTSQSKPAVASACRAIHPEDLLVGDYVTVLQESHQIGTFTWCGIDPHQFPPNETIEITIRGNFDALKVKDICFPFILCTDNQGEVHVIDTRSNQLGKLSKSFIGSLKKATKAQQRKLAKQKKSKKRKKNKSKK